MGRFIFICISSRCLLPCLECLDPSEQSDWDDTEDTMDNELLLLSKPWSGEGEGNWGDQGCWSLHLLLHPLASRRLLGYSFIIRTIVYRHISRWGGPWGIKLERLLGLQVYLGTSKSPSCYSIIWYGLGNGLSAFLYCHWVGVEVGQFSYPHSGSCEEECGIPSLVHL